MSAVKKQEVAVAEPRQVAVTPIELLEKAIATNNLELVEKFMALQERWEASQAKKAYNRAIAAAKKELPVIKKNRHVGFDSSRGGARTDYDHEDLAGIAEQIDEILTAHGLSYRWRTEQKIVGDVDRVYVTCIVSHEDGYSEENTLGGPIDLSGNKNNIQGIGSTQTYLARYTLKAALGLAAGKDDDATAVDNATLSAAQVAELDMIIQATKFPKKEDRDAHVRRFCKFMRVDKIGDILSKRFDIAREALINERDKINDIANDKGAA